jgi:hypothetical protein
MGENNDGKIINAINICESVKNFSELYVRLQKNEKINDQEITYCIDTCDEFMKQFLNLIPRDIINTVKTMPRSELLMYSDVQKLFSLKYDLVSKTINLLYSNYPEFMYKTQNFVKVYAYIKEYDGVLEKRIKEISYELYKEKIREENIRT